MNGERKEGNNYLQLLLIAFAVKKFFVLFFFHFYNSCESFFRINSIILSSNIFQVNNRKEIYHKLKSTVLCDIFENTAHEEKKDRRVRYS